MTEEIEKIYVVPLKQKGFKSSVAAPTAVKRVKQFLTKHMKTEAKDIWIDDSLNRAIWKHGKYKMPSKIRVKAVKFDDGVVEAYLPELEFKKSRRELLKEAREKKAPILVKEEEEAEEEPGEISGTEDYAVSPAADGKVKIKKKKTPKAKNEEKEGKEGKKPVKKTKKKEKPSEKTEKAKEKPAKKSKKGKEGKTEKKAISKPKTAKKKSAAEKTKKETK